jgi:hypothetical protein
MARNRWRWKRTKMLVEAGIIGLTAGLVIILFTEAGVDRQRTALDSTVACDAGDC